MTIINKAFYKTEVEDICKEAVARLRANQGCDITFRSLDDGSNPWDDPLKISIYYINMKFHGEFIKFACQAGVFMNDMPTNKDEERALISTNNIRAMLVIRIAKIIFEYYLGWLKQNGLSAKVNTNVAQDTSTGPSVSKLQIGGKSVALNDTYARATISNVADSVTDLKDALEQEKQRNQSLQDRLDMMEDMLRAKGLL